VSGVGFQLNYVVKLLMLSYAYLQLMCFRIIKFIYLIYLYCSPNIVGVVKSKKNEMGGACGAYGGGERCAQGSGWET
jgi:hypothetical protein